MGTSIEQRPPAVRVTVRRARPSDVRQISRIASLEVAVIVGLMDQPKSRFFVGLDGCNQVLGATVYSDNGESLLGPSVVVDEGYRRLGIGTQLVACLLTELHSRDKYNQAEAGALLEERLDLLCLWRKCGFIAHSTEACQRDETLVNLIYRRQWHREREGLGQDNMARLLLEGE